MKTTYIIILVSSGKKNLKDELVLRKFFLRKRDMMRYYNRLKKMIKDKGYETSFRNISSRSYSGISTNLSAYYNCKTGKDLMLIYYKILYNIKIDKKKNKVVLYDDGFGNEDIGNGIHVFDGVDAGIKAIFDDGKLTFDHFS